MGGRPVNLEGTGGEASGLAMAATGLEAAVLVVFAVAVVVPLLLAVFRSQSRPQSRSRSLSLSHSAFFGGGTGGSGARGCGLGSGRLSGAGSGARSKLDSNSKVGREGGAGRALEKRERPVFGGCRVAGPIMAAVDIVGSWQGYYYVLLLHRPGAAPGVSGCWDVGMLGLGSSQTRVGRARMWCRT